MSDRILGLDLSRWQGLFDWKYCAEETDVKFAFIRAGSIDNYSGECYEDYQFKENTEAHDYMPVGFYWYFRPNHDPIKQANYFSNLIFPESWLLPPVIDVEDNGGLSPSAYADAIREFLDEVERSIGYKCIIYTSRSKWAQVEPRPHWPVYDLWVAHYTLQDEPLMPEGWGHWHFWQWTSSAMGVDYGALPPPNAARHIDLDYFNGTIEDLHEYIGIPHMPTWVKVNKIDNAVYRDGPMGMKVGIAGHGVQHRVVDMAHDEDGRLWYHFGGDRWINAKRVEVVE